MLAFCKGMPITYLINRSLRVVFAVYKGKTSLDEIVQYAKRLSTDPDFDSTFSELAVLHDFSGSNLTASNLKYFAEEDDPFSLKSARAIYAPSQVAFGTARMYQALRDQAGTLEVFRILEEACRWLGLEHWVSALTELALLDEWDKNNGENPQHQEEIDSRKSRQQRREEIMEQIRHSNMPGHDHR